MCSPAGQTGKIAAPAYCLGTVPGQWFSKACQRDRLLGFALCSDGSMNGCLRLPYQPIAAPLMGATTVQKGTFHPITMNGREVYKFAVNRVPEVIEKALFRAELTADDIDWLVLHQANQRILDAVAESARGALRAGRQQHDQPREYFCGLHSPGSG